MRIAVLGAGVIGVTTAYELGRQGHEVIVIDKAGSVATDASYANGAQLSYSYVDPFSNPHILKSLPRYIAGFDPAIKLGFTWHLAYYAWGLEFLKNCTRKRANKNIDQLLDQSCISKDALSQIHNEVPSLKLQASGKGKIILARSTAEMEAFKRSVELKSQKGFQIDVLYRDEILEKEPALKNWQDHFIGGTYSPQDRVIDAVGFCEELKSLSEKNFAVQYYFDQSIKNLKTQQKKIRSVISDKQEFNCDAAVVCLGNDANAVLKTVGLSCRTYSMRGYSLTLPATDESPGVSVTDPQSKMVFANLGSQIRIAGFLDANLAEKKIEQRGTQLLASAKKLWPGAADYEQENNLWSGLRPMTPSGVPYIGPSPIKGLFYNLGHGSYGLTLANGSAQQIAKMIGAPLQKNQTSERLANYA